MNSVLFFVHGVVQIRSKYFLCRHSRLSMLGTTSARDSEWIFVVAKLGGKFQLDVRVNGCYQSRRAVAKWIDS